MLYGSIIWAAGWHRHLTLMMFLLTLVGCSVSLSAAAITVPPGFYLVAEETGVKCYRKDYTAGTPDFVLVTDLNQARFTSRIGDIVDPGTGQGPLGGDNPRILRLSLEEHWNRARAADSKTFAVLNGQFFNYPDATTANLAFSLHSNYQHISDGYGIGYEYPGQILLLQTDQVQRAATVQSFDVGVFHDPAGPDHRVAGLTTDADKGPYNYTGRTFIGVHDSNGDGRNDTLLVFVSAYASQISAAEVLSAFGANGQVMFDGGGSSQLIVNGAGYVNSSRAIPHAFVVIADPPPAPTPIAPPVPTPIPPPSAPNPSITWLDQGLNSGDSQQVRVTCGMPNRADSLYYEMSGAGTNSYGWTGSSTYTDTGVYDSQTVSARCKARGPGGESGWSGWVSVYVKDRTPPSDPSPGTPVWFDQGLNSRDTQKVESTIPLPPPDATQVWHRLMSGAMVLQDSGWTASTAWMFNNVGDEQWVKVNGRARDAEGNYTGWVASDQVWIKDRTPPGAPTITRDWPGILRQEAGVPSINPYRLKGAKTEDTAAIWLNGSNPGADFPTSTGWEAYSLIHDGDNTVSAVAKDEEGNYSEEVVEETIRVEIKKWYVDDDLPDRADGFPLDGFTPATAYRKIGEANFWADDWDEISVAEGIYRERVEMVFLTGLRGAGRGLSIIEGPGWGNTVSGAWGGHLEGFTIRGSGCLAGDYGVGCEGINWFTVKNCTVEGNFDGIGVSGGENVTVLNNIVAGSTRYGVVSSSTAARVENNTIDRNGLSGLFCSEAGKSEIKNNIITRNHIGVEVFRGAPGIRYNNVWGNRLADYKNCSAGVGDISVDPKYKDE